MNDGGGDENKRSLISFLCDMDHTNQLLSLTGGGGPYTHEEADVVIISYLLQLIQQGKTHIQVLADDTDIFVRCCVSAGSRRHLHI